MNPRISAVICTHNRASYLQKALSSLMEQTLEKCAYEILIVDNGSSDETKDVVQRFSEVPNLRYLFEPSIGLSRARNTGWHHARGEYVAFLDDDAVACREWLQKYLQTFETFSPKPGCVGGRVLPVWEAPRPDWLSDKMLGTLSVFDWSDFPLVIDDGMGLSGCNIAFLRELLQLTGGFPVELGRQGNRLLGGEEVLLRRRVAGMGYSIVYSPDILVNHSISASRLTKQWFCQETYSAGHSKARMVRLENHLSRVQRVVQIMTRIGWLLPRFPLMFLEPDSAERFWRQCQVRRALGFVAGMCLDG